MAENEVQFLDERFRACIKLSARLEQLWTGARWTEGPAYFPALRSLIFSDIPNDRMLRWDETTGQVGVFRAMNGYYTNGNTVDREGRLVSAEHGARRITRTEHDGRITVLADKFEGKRFNSPNDVVVKSDGSVWFTDPAYGIDSNYEGFEAKSEIGGCHLYRLDPANGRLSKVADDFDRPNGLAFSLDERKLYVADSGAPKHMRVFEVGERGALGGGRVFATCTAGAFDGFRLDDRGRIWTSTADGVHCLDPDGTLIGKIPVPERVSNLCFGGAKRNRLFITATASLYSFLLPVNGAKTF
jgi:gluconolactonase